MIWDQLMNGFTCESRNNVGDDPETLLLEKYQAVCDHLSDEKEIQVKDEPIVGW